MNSWKQKEEKVWWTSTAKWKKDSVAISISDETDFKKIRNIKENCYKIIKDSAQQEDITILNMYNFK